VLSTSVLVLNRLYQPVHVTSVRRAIILLYRGAAKAVDEQYQTFDFESWADLAVAILPPAQGGGFGLVKRSAGRAIRLLSGFQPVEPLSGQRALTHEALEACRPLSAGFGVETGMTIDAVRRGFRVVEVRADLDHRATGRGLGGFAHRGRQGVDVVLAVLPRALGLR